MRKHLVFLLALCLAGALAAGCSASGRDVEDVDVDLTAMSSIVARAKFYNIMENAADYLGNTIRARGEYFSFFIDEFGRYAHYVTIVEGDGICCPPDGFEIKLTGDGVGPGDYPDQDTMIEVVGVLGRYEEQGQGYLYIAIDEITIRN